MFVIIRNYSRRGFTVFSDLKIIITGVAVTWIGMLTDFGSVEMVRNLIYKLRI
jgi:hypothetical protein